LVGNDIMLMYVYVNIWFKIMPSKQITCCSSWR